MALAEGAEAEFMFAFEHGAPPDAQRALGMAQHRLGPVAVLAMANDPSGGYWSKTLGFRADTPATDDLVRDVLDLYRANGNEVAVVQVQPGCPAGELGRRLRPERAGGRADLGQASTPPTSMPHRPAPTCGSPRWDRPTPTTGSVVYCRGFGMPEHPSLVEFFGGATRRHRWVLFHPWGAWDGDRLVAGANLHVAGPAAAFCGAATLPEARGRGAQSVFMQRRVEGRPASWARPG